VTVLPQSRVVHYLFSDTPQRRRLVERRQHGEGTDADRAERYCLYGADVLADAGYHVRHNLERPRPGSRALRYLAGLTWHALVATGAYAGDFVIAYGDLPRVNRCDVLVSTVDAVGIPMVLLNALGRVRPPMVYLSIGLPERIGKIRSERWRRFYRRAYRQVACIASYGVREAQWIREWLGPEGAPPVHFVPFGVDADYFGPRPGVPCMTDVLSIGADIQRDFPLLLVFAARNPARSLTIITRGDHAAALSKCPPNVSVLMDVPFAEIREHLASARVVALPVKENTYSGATTTLLQAMAMAKPVVLSEVGAVRGGYGLTDQVNCQLVEPHDPYAMEAAIKELLVNPEQASAMGLRAREHVTAHLTWTHYTERLRGLIDGAADGQLQTRGPLVPAARN